MGVSSFGRPQPPEVQAPPEHVPNLGKATMDLVMVPQLDQAALARAADHLAAVLRAAVFNAIAAGLADAVQEAEQAAAGPDVAQPPAARA